MIRVVFLLLPLVLLSLAPAAHAEPVVHLPAPLERENWTAPEGDGSCVHATFSYLLHWQGEHERAYGWRQTYSGGETSTSLAMKLDAAGIRYAMTAGRCDVAFLEMAIQTRRGAGVGLVYRVTVPHRRGYRTAEVYHMVILAGMDAEHVWLLDVNDLSRFVKMRREVFIRAWCSAESWAVTPVYTPAAPLPRYRY